MSPHIIEDRPRHDWGTDPVEYPNIICVLCGQVAAWNGRDSLYCEQECPPTMFDPSDHDVRCDDYMGNRCPGFHDGKNSRTIIWHWRYVVQVTTHRGKTVSTGRRIREWCDSEHCNEVIVGSPYAARKRALQGQAP